MFWGIMTLIEVDPILKHGAYQINLINPLKTEFLPSNI
jgi:hypothetical protein